MPLLSLAQFPRTYREMSAVRGTRRASRRCGTGVGAPYASSTNGGANTNTNSVFCADNVKLDKAFSNSQSDSEALTALKSNQSVTNEMSAHLPPGTVGNEAKQILSAAQQGIAKNDVSVLNSVSNNNYGGDIDTYCGVNTNGYPLPTDFAKGKGSAPCNVESTLSQGVGDASDSSAALSYLKSHQNDINAFASEVSTLPSSVQADAQTLVSTSRTAISSNDPSGLESLSFQDAASSVDLYCGNNH